MKMNREKLITIICGAAAFLACVLFLTAWKLYKAGFHSFGVIIAMCASGWLLMSVLMTPEVRKKLFGASPSNTKVEAV